MPSDDRKRQERQDKRAIKQSGKRQKRRFLKRQLENHPEDATSRDDDYRYGASHTSEPFNRKPGREAEVEEEPETP